MDIREALLAEHSKRQTIRIVEYVGADTAKFAELMQLFLGPVYRVSQRAAWPVSYCVERHPELITPYFGKLAKELEREDSHVAVRRNVARLLQFVEIPKRYSGRIFDACYNLVDDPAQPVAVRVFAMTVAVKLADGSPELLAELKLIAEKYPDNITAGLRSRMRKPFGDK